MATGEIYSFVEKFVSLWKSGLDASLSFETQAGEASVSLRLGLGTFSSEANTVEKQSTSKKVSPSRLRRRQRREKARIEAAARLGSQISMNQTSEEDVASPNVYVEVTTKAEVSEEEALSQTGILTAETNDENANEERNFATVKVDACDQDITVESELQVETERGEESDLSTQLHNMIKQSRKNRKLWKKFNTLPS